MIALGLSEGSSASRLLRAIEYAKGDTVPLSTATVAMAGGAVAVEHSTTAVFFVARRPDSEASSAVKSQAASVPGREVVIGATDVAIPWFVDEAHIARRVFEAQPEGGAIDLER